MSVGSVVWYLYVHERGREILRRHESLVERRGILDPRDQRIGDRLAGLVMDEVVVDDLIGEQPALQQLRLELGVVAHSAVERRIGDRRGQRVQRMPELVE